MGPTLVMAHPNILRPLALLFLSLWVFSVLALLVQLAWLLRRMCLRTTASSLPKSVILDMWQRWDAYASLSFYTTMREVALVPVYC